MRAAQNCLENKGPWARRVCHDVVAHMAGRNFFRQSRTVVYTTSHDGDVLAVTTR